MNLQKQETKENIPAHEFSKEDSSIPSEKNAEGSEKNKSSFQKMMSNLKKTIFLLAVLSLFIGGPIALLGLTALGILAAKPLSKMAKEKTNLLKAQNAREKRVEKSGKLGRVTETTTLEMNKQSLRSMGTKPDGVSIKKIPKDQSKATTNGNKLERVTETSTLEMDKQSLRSMGTKPDGVSPKDQSKATTNGNKLERVTETSSLEMDKQSLRSMGTKPDGVSPKDQSKATTNGNKLERVTETSTLEMDKQSLKSMGTKPDGISIKKLPEDHSKATTNGNKLADSKFKKLGMPQAKLNKQALERRNSLSSKKKSKPLAKSKDVPNLKNSSPTLKLKRRNL